MVNGGDPYEIKKYDNKESWEKSFTYILFKTKDNRGKKKGTVVHSSGYNLEKQKERDIKLKEAVRMLGNLKETEISGIVDMLNKKTFNSEHFEKSDFFIGGSDKHYILPGKSDGSDGSDSDGSDSDGSYNYIFYKLYYFETLLNSDKFLKSFEIMFNLICRIINRVIKKLLPMVRRISGNMFQNVGAFIFSLGGPFTEILWFGFNSVLTLGDISKSTFSIVDEIGDITPGMDDNGLYKFTQSTMIHESESESLENLLNLANNISQKQGGGRRKTILEIFDRKIMKHLNYFY